MLSAFLDWPQSTFISNLELKDKKITSIREVDGGLEHLECSLPAIVSVDLRLNEPRYASLPNIMKAKRKPLEEISPDELGVDTKKRLETVKVEEPPSREAGMILDSVEDLVDKLKNEAKVI
jgi:electron transfer flavoprotein beta subunit